MYIIVWNTKHTARTHPHPQPGIRSQRQRQRNAVSRLCPLYLFSLSAKAYGYATEKMLPAKTIERENERREPKVGSDIRRLEDQTSAAAAVTDVLSLWFTDSYDQTFFSSNKVLSECLCIGSVRTKTRKDSKRSMRLSLEKRGRSVLEN